MRPQHEKMVAFIERWCDFAVWTEGAEDRGFLTRHLLLIAGEHGLSNTEYEATDAWHWERPDWGPFNEMGREVLWVKPTPHTEARYYYLKALSTKQRREVTDKAFMWRVY